MMLQSATALSLGAILLLATGARTAQESQLVLGAPSNPRPAEHGLQSILAALDVHHDPVDAFISLYPEAKDDLAQPRLLHVLGRRAGENPKWGTEGDKLRLRRRGKKFIDLTDHHEFYAGLPERACAGKANLPDLIHQDRIAPLLPKVSTTKIHDFLQKFTGFHNRYYNGASGERSCEWLHDHIADIINSSPFGTHISLEYFTHPFPQSSIIARFEPKARNFSQPLTILGAHQDSINHHFPLLPAPGADDDGSGTATILEAFRVLAGAGYTPKNGPVEFHWYAGEEGGLLGSQSIARYKKEQNAPIGALLDFDMTAFVARNATESMGILSTQSDPALTNWTVKLAEEYISIPARIYDLGFDAGSDYMAFTKLGYPTAIGTEGNPMRGGSFPGDTNPYIHGVKDTMDVDDDAGFFSIEHVARFSELAIAFAVEQGGWESARRR